MQVPNRPRRVSAALSSVGIGVAIVLLTTLATDPALYGQSGNRKSQSGGPSSVQQKPVVARRPSSDVYTYPINVSGRATDRKGKPVAGARIYLACYRAEYKRLAETTTDKNGRYEFRKIPLPIQRAKHKDGFKDGFDSGVFEVFGQAAGYGFAWRPEKWFSPKGNPSAGISIHYDEDDDLPRGYWPGQKIVLDLKFRPPATLSGRFVDDRGKPIVGAEIAIFDCDPIPAGGFKSEPELLRLRMIHNFTVLNSRSIVPAEMKIRKTDKNGEFKFTGLPPNCRMRLSVRVDGFTSRMLFTATRKDAKQYEGGQTRYRLYTDGMKVVFARPREVPIKVVYSDSNLPAPKVWVSLGHPEGAGSSASSDQNGMVTLRVPPGKCRLSLSPAHRTSYLPTTTSLSVADKPPKAPVIVRLKQAAIVEVTVVDDATGKGVSDIGLWRGVYFKAPGQPRRFVHVEYFYRSWEEKTRIHYVNRPRSTTDGRMRFLIEPGKHRIGLRVEAFQPRYTPVDKDGKEIECETGDVTKVTLRVRKR